jgi:hypothetical protein
MPPILHTPLQLPRWEWRTIADSLGDLCDKLASVHIDRVRNIREIYLLCSKSNHNAKIREGLMDLKWRQQVDRFGLELWDPVLKSTFPCDQETILQLFGGWGIPLPELKRGIYSLPEFLNEVIAPHPDLKAVTVTKVREGFALDGTTCERVRLEVAGIALESFCVEHEDPRLVLQILQKLGLDTHQNINYALGLKRALARQAA